MENPAKTDLFGSLVPELPPTLESALSVPPRETMRNPQNKRFFRNWFHHRQEKKKDYENDEAEHESTSAQQSAFDGNGLQQSTVDRLTEISLKPMCPSLVLMEPQLFLDNMLASRGYSTKRFQARKTAYYSCPTVLQLASHDVFLVELVRQRQIDTISAMLDAGISPNPCDARGQTVMHMVSRRGDAELLSVFQKAGGTFQHADELGRTPLHDAFWASEPSFATVEMILAQDRRMLHLADCRNALPLSLARKEHWSKWTAFFDSMKDRLWPKRSSAKEEADPLLATLPPNARSVPNPKNALTPELAAMVVSGSMDPEEARMLCHDNVEEAEDETEPDVVDRDYKYTTMQNLTEKTFDESDMADILATLSAPKKTHLEAEVQVPSIEEFAPKRCPSELLGHSESVMNALLAEEEDDSFDSDEDSSDFDSDYDSEYDDSEDDIMDQNEMNEILAGLAAVGPKSKQSQAGPVVTKASVSGSMASLPLVQRG